MTRRSKHIMSLSVALLLLGGCVCGKTAYFRKVDADIDGGAQGEICRPRPEFGNRNEQGVERGRVELLEPEEEPKLRHSAPSAASGRVRLEAREGASSGLSSARRRVDGPVP